ncbi:MAG TPA: glycosyltransferase, partial [Rhodothermales bacterium]|nr:glycosyltransferase [Rhodothermales bacterium]
MELRPEFRSRPRLPLVQALRYALVPTLIWGGLFLLILSALPGWAWRAKVQIRREEGLLMIGLIGMWRYGWYLLQVVRGFFYSRFVYPSLRYSAFIQRSPFPERCYFLIPSYFEDPGVTVRVFRALAREAGLIPQVQITAVAALGSDEEEAIVRRAIAETPGGERLRLVCTRQQHGKRKAMADALRVIAQLRARDVQYVADRERSYHDVVVFMDGDTEMAEGTLAQCLPFFKAYPRV